MAGDDYVAAKGTVVFESGEKSARVSGCAWASERGVSGGGRKGCNFAQFAVPVPLCTGTCETMRAHCRSIELRTPSP